MRRALAMISLSIAACTRQPPPSADAAPSATADAAQAAPSPAPSAVEPPALAPPPPAPAMPVAEWVWKPFRGEGFSALFPGDPKILMLPAEDDKLGTTQAVLDVPGGQVSFAITVTDFPESEVGKPQAFLDDHAQPPRRGTTEILHKRAITLDGHPGRVLIMRRNISGTPLKVYSRLYLKGRKLFSLIVSTLDTGGVSEDVVKRFMESFKLV
ncbi:MAG: hypothetical protein KF819_17785 [Labilithrix sp.]|nr:hypothetical protein [Labilithrix sp.]